MCSAKEQMWNTLLMRSARPKFNSKPAIGVQHRFNVQHQRTGAQRQEDALIFSPVFPSLLKIAIFSLWLFQFNNEDMKHMNWLLYPFSFNFSLIKTHFSNVLLAFSKCFVLLTSDFCFLVGGLITLTFGRSWLCH